MTVSRLTLKLDSKVIETLKKNAESEGKSLAEFITNRSIIFQDQLTRGLILRTSFISQKSFERDIYRVDVDVNNIKFGRYLLVHRYEIWFSLESIEDKYNLKEEPGLPELASFAFDVVKNQYESTFDSNNERVLPVAYGYYLKNSGVQIANSREDLWRYLDNEGVEINK